MPTRTICLLHHPIIYHPSDPPHVRKIISLMTQIEHLRAVGEAAAKEIPTAVARYWVFAKMLMDCATRMDALRINNPQLDAFRQEINQLLETSNLARRIVPGLPDPESTLLSLKTRLNSLVLMDCEPLFEHLKESGITRSGNRSITISADAAQSLPRDHQRLLISALVDASQIHAGYQNFPDPKIPQSDYLLAADIVVADLEYRKLQSEQIRNSSFKHPSLKPRILEHCFMDMTTFLSKDMHVITDDAYGLGISSFNFL